MTGPVPHRLDALRALLPASMVGDRHWAEPRLLQAEQRLARGQPADRLLGEVERRLAASAAEAARRAALALAIDYPEQLPVAARRDEILALLARERLFVLTGETGSGKTTQLPKMVYESGCGRRGMIALTQPRRVAAVAMAARLREECRAGEGLVAHSVRFDDRATPDTAIRVMTDGLLLAEAANDPDLSRYDAVIIDEAHERSLNIDLLLGLIKLLRARRPDLTVVVSSASIEAERFAAFFASGPAASPAPILRVSGRTFPVEVRYQPPGDDDIGYLAAALAAIRSLHAEGGPGDVLAFLPTERDIIEARRRLDDLAGTSVLPLFGRLTPKEQQRVFAPARGRKIVLSTNLAETSLTIPGIRYVVDTGLARLKRYQASSRTERLPVEAVSQASCTQRAGRAGRVEAGVCIRLFGADDFAARLPYTTPEILRSNLAGVLLQCLGMGVGDPEHFPWLDAPSAHAWQQARVLLDELGAFDGRPMSDVRRPTSRGKEDSSAGGVASGAAHAQPGPNDIGHRTSDVGRLSALGRQMASIPADPQVARILLAGVAEGVAHEACTIAAFLSVQDPRVRPLGQEAKADAAHRALAHEAGDLATVLRLWERYQAAGSGGQRSRLCEATFLGFRRMREWADVRHQLWQSLREGRAAGRTLPSAGHEAERWPLDRVHRAVLAGMLGNVLMYDPEERAYRGAGDRRLHVHPGSALRSGKGDDGKRAPPPQPWLVACEVVETSRLFARLCAPIDPAWVVDLAGDRVKRRHRDPHWHAKRRQVVCRETVTWKGLPVREGRLVPYERVDPADATAVFVREALGGEDLERDFPFVARNRAVLEAARRLRARLRDPALHVDELALERFYRERLGLDGGAPVCIASTDALRRWLATHGDDRLQLSLADLVDPALVERADRDFPEVVAMGGREFRLTYRFAPGDDDDGATLELAEEHLAQVDVARLEWLVPGRLGETVEALLEQLPKEQRRRLIPLADSARGLADELSREAGRAPLAVLVAAAVRARTGQPCALPDPTALPAHLRLRFRIAGPGGATVYAGRDPQFLAAQAAASGDRLRALRAEWETAPSGAWPGDCPLEIALHGVTAATALVRARDERGGVAARRAVFATAAAAQAWHDDGLDALLEAALAADLERIALAPAGAAAAARCERQLGMRIGALRRQLALAAMAAAERGTVRDQPAFDDLRQRAAAALRTAEGGFDALIEQAATRLEQLRARLKQGAKSLAAATVARVATRHLEHLMAPGWAGRLPWAGLQRLPAYLDGLARFLDAASARALEAQRAAERCAALLALWDETMGEVDARLPAALGLGRRLGELAWVLEECLLAAGEARGGGAGYAEGRLRAGLAEVDKQLSAAQSANAQLRQRLLDLRPVVARLSPGPARDRLGAECDRLIAEVPDLGLGCDLWAQRQAVAALAERVGALAARG